MNGTSRMSISIANLAASLKRETAAVAYDSCLRAASDSETFASFTKLEVYIITCGKYNCTRFSRYESYVNLTDFREHLARLRTARFSDDNISKKKYTLDYQLSFANFDRR